MICQQQLATALKNTATFPVTHGLHMLCVSNYIQDYVENSSKKCDAKLKPL
jgi:hypothetical protein